MGWLSSIAAGCVVLILAGCGRKTETQLAASTHSGTDPRSQTQPSASADQPSGPRLQWSAQGDGAGDIIFHWVLGMQLAEGVGRPKDLAGAVRHFKIAADQGHVLAASALAVLLHSNQALARDALQQARRYSHLAAVAGDSEANYNYGVMQVNGEGGAANVAEAVIAFCLAKRLGDDSGRKALEHLLPSVAPDIRVKQLASCAKWRFQATVPRAYQDRADFLSSLLAQKKAELAAARARDPAGSFSELRTEVRFVEGEVDAWDHELNFHFFFDSPARRQWTESAREWLSRLKSHPDAKQREAVLIQVLREFVTARKRLGPPPTKGSRFVGGMYELHETFGGVLEEPIVSVLGALEKVDRKHPVYASIEAASAASEEQLPELEKRLVTVQYQLRVSEEFVRARKALLSFLTAQDPEQTQSQDR